MGIARTYAVTLRELLEANGITEAHILHPGDELIIPASGQRPTPTAVPSEIVHIVQRGDRLEDIVERYNVSETRIRQANDLSAEDAIQAGDELIIPLDLSPTPEALAEPTATHTPTPGPAYAAPQLLYPADDETVTGKDAAVILQWASVGILQENEWYALQVDYLGERPGGQESELTVYTRVTSWRLPAEWYPGPGAGQSRFLWKVDVVRNREGMEEPTVISAPSFVRHFDWK
jgi:LysM repeat protein